MRGTEEVTPGGATGWLLDFLACWEAQHPQQQQQAQQEQQQQAQQPGSLTAGAPANLLRRLPPGVGYPQVAAWFKDFLLRDAR